MNTFNKIQKLQNAKKNQRPKVVYYMELKWDSCRNNEIDYEIEQLVLADKLIWGRTPHTLWFATELSELDRAIIADTKGWKIEQDINQ